jgi:hypothetical protein
VQGQLGTCYFICALSTLAEDSKRVTQLYVGSNTDRSAHAVMFFMRGRWTGVIVDDLFPWFNGTGKPAACQSIGLEKNACVWPALFEKVCVVVVVVVVVISVPKINRTLFEFVIHEFQRFDPGVGQSARQLLRRRGRRSAFVRAAQLDWTASASCQDYRALARGAVVHSQSGLVVGLFISQFLIFRLLCILNCAIELGLDCVFAFSSCFQIELSIPHVSQAQGDHTVLCAEIESLPLLTSCLPFSLNFCGIFSHCAQWFMELGPVARLFYSAFRDLGTGLYLLVTAPFVLLGADIISYLWHSYTTGN